MTHYNFDETIDRTGTDSIKYDATKAFLGAEGIIPMWVADMDFRTPSFIVEAMKARMNHEIFAYTFRSDSYIESVMNWLQRRHQWGVPKEAVLFSPGVVPAVNIAVLAYTQPGDRIITQPPVYFPFFHAVNDHGRELVYNPLILKEGRLYMDFENLEMEAKKGAKMLILSSPHNPGGSVWTQEELRTMAEICLRYNILILSDEIHCDLILPGYKHTPTASLSAEIADQCITTIAASKTFNLSGLSTSTVIITHAELREKFKTTLDALHIGGGNIFGSVATQAAYTYGDEWVDALMVYLSENLDILEEYLQKHIPQIKMVRPEATFLVWLDCRELGMKDKELNHFFLTKAKLGLNPGTMFGPGGSGFMRMNVACTKATLMQALEGLHHALSRRFVSPPEPPVGEGGVGE